MEDDYYKILGIAPDADIKRIRESYRELAFKYHPDRNAKDPAASEQMKTINEAYAVLSNPNKRAEYDMMRTRFGSSAYQEFRHTHTDQDIFSGSDINEIFEEVAKTFGLRGFDDIFKEFYGQQAMKSFHFGGPGFGGRGFVFFGVFGIMPVLNLLKSVLFSPFSGFLPKSDICTEIPGKGRDVGDEITISPDLAKNGGPYAYLHKKTSRKLIVRIPPGIRDGQRIRLSGLGEKRKNTDTPGDLYLNVRIGTGILDKMKNLLKLSV
jgi:DnaJ-class molecular chaperone